MNVPLLVSWKVLASEFWAGEDHQVIIVYHAHGAHSVVGKIAYFLCVMVL